MAMPEFQGLIDWCESPSDRPHLRRVVGVTVNEVDGDDRDTGLLGEWTGYLTYTGQRADDVVGFEGVLPATPGAVTGHSNPIDLTLSVGDMSAWARLRGDGMRPAWSEDLPVVPSVSDACLVEGTIASGDPEHRFSFFAYATYTFAG